MRFHKGRDVFECVSRVVGRAVLTCGNRRSENDARRATLNSKLFTLNSSGFTLIELLIVTVVIVTLMGIVFRLAGVGGGQRAKSTTQARLQRLENAISGYYAAYGSYPPVPLQGRSRDINLQVNSYGVQTDKRPVNLSNPQADDLRGIEAACRAQPVAVAFPFFMYEHDKQDRKDKAEKIVDYVVKAQEWSGDYKMKNVGNLISKGTPMFQFGLLSFLMPRYLFMLQGDPEMYDGNPQWTKNNQLPCRIDTGQPYETWESMQQFLYRDGRSEASLISNLTSQAVCARWMPNLEHIVSGGLDFYGVDTATSDYGESYLNGSQYNCGNPKTGKIEYQAWMRVFTPDPKSSAGHYLLNGMTVADGWGHEFYYYADTPYQSYRLWSAGADGRTFPPWLDVGSFQNAEQKTITGWTKDDICHLANSN